MLLNCEAGNGANLISLALAHSLVCLFLGGLRAPCFIKLEHKLRVSLIDEAVRGFETYARRQQAKEFIDAAKTAKELLKAILRGEMEQ